MKEIMKKGFGKRILAFVLSIVIVATTLSGISNASDDSTGDIVKNTFEENDADFSSFTHDGSYKGTSNDVMPKGGEGFFSAFNAWVEKGAGENGGSAMKITNGQEYTDRYPASFLIYDKNDSGYGQFVPKANTTYKIAIKYKIVSETTHHNVQIRLRELVDGKMFVSSDWIKELGTIVDTPGATDGWVTGYSIITTNDNPAPWYIAISSSNATWYCNDLEMYIDNIEITEKVYKESTNVMNDFDETDIAYTNTEGWFSNAMTFSAKKGNNGELCADHASIEKNVGVDGSKAARFWQIRSSSENDQAVSYVRLYDTAENDYRLFTPSAASTYTISLKIKAVASSKNIHVQLRSAAADGTVSYNDKVVASLNTEAIVASADAKWQELTATFTTGDTVAPLYLTLKSHDTWWAIDAEVYVDDINIKKKVYVPSEQVTNTYDENYTYMNTDEWQGRRKYTLRDGDSGIRLTDFATIENNVGINESNAISFEMIRGSSSKDDLVSYVKLYDTEDNDYTFFKPQKTSQYSISLKIKAVECTKNIVVQLRSAATDGTVSNTDSVLVSLTDNAIVASVDNDWMELKANFITTGTVSPLYIALVAHDGWWDETNPKVYLDDIKIDLIKTWDEETPDEKDGIWTGKPAAGIAQGQGTADNPYLITNGAELAYAIINNGENGKYYKLNNDIVLNDVSTADWYKNKDNNVWIEGTRASVFNGHIDGNGHIVYGVWYPDDCNYTSAGLVPTLGNGSVKNIGIRYAHINAARYGGLVGLTVKGGVKNIEQCFADNTVRVYYRGGSDNLGDCGVAGIVGMTHTDFESDIPQLNILNCYSKAAVYNTEANTKANGIIGYEWASLYTIKNCYSVGYAPHNGAQENRASRYYVDSSGNVLRDVNEVYKNIYNDTRAAWGYECFEKVDLKNMMGDAAKSYMPGLDYNDVFLVVEGTTPMLKIFKSENFDGSDSKDGVNISGYESGAGTKESPYIIKTAEQLKKLVSDSNTKGSYYELAKDIYLNDTTDPNWMSKNPTEWTAWTSDVAFMGNLDGKGYSIHGLYMNGEPSTNENKIESSGTALFPFTGENSVIRNVHVRDSYLSCSGIVGGITCKVNPSEGKYAYIIGCSVDESVTLKGQTVGGIVGAGGRGARIVYSYSSAKIVASSEGRGNGIVGDIWSSDYNLVQCYSVGYPVYRGNYTPVICRGVYGTEEQIGIKTLTKAKMTGANAKKNMTEFDWDNVWYTESGKYPQLKVTTEKTDIKFDDEGVVGRPWSGLMATKYAGGSGTAKDPYLIETPEQLARVIMTADGWTHYYYKLIADIKINDTSKPNWKKTAKDWISTTSVFSGHFNGNGHVVSGLYYNITDGSALYAGLFPVAGTEAVIEKVGVINSYLINKTSDPEGGANAGAIVGFISGWLRDGENSKLPIVRQCFADDSVTVDAKYAGGIVGGSAGPVEMENCYFTGKIIGEKYGALIGDSWQTQRHVVSNCYASTEDKDPIVGNVGLYRADYSNIYTDGSDPKAPGVKKLNLVLMQNEYPREYMENFDFEKIWKTVEGGTPVLRVFNSDAYSSKREPQKVMIEFISNGGSECEPIYGYARIDKLTELPTPKRHGYKFIGWYHFAELDLPCTLEAFPDYDTYLYAKWEPLGFTIDFETKYDKKYDYNEGTVHFAPGTHGYSKKYVHQNLRSMHCLGTAKEGSTFLLSYENQLEVGKEYEMSFWVYTDSKDISGTMDILHTKYPDVNASTVGYEEIFKLKKIKEGSWEQHTVKFTANAPYVIIRTSEGANLYFDDITVFATGDEGRLSELLGTVTPNNFVILSVVIATVVGSGIIVSLLVYAKYKKRKK